VLTWRFHAGDFFISSIQCDGGKWLCGVERIAKQENASSTRSVRLILTSYLAVRGLIVVNVNYNTQPKLAEVGTPASLWEK
jgi:hypothetical protein